MEFKDTVKMIAKSEKKVDEVLKAARLERHERVPMSNERLGMILGYATAMLGMILFTAFFAFLFGFC